MIPREDQQRAQARSLEERVARLENARPPSAPNLRDLFDAKLTKASDGQVPTYDQASGTWVPTTPSSGGGGGLGFGNRYAGAEIGTVYGNQAVAANAILDLGSFTAGLTDYYVTNHSGVAFATASIDGDGKPVITINEDGIYRLESSFRIGVGEGSAATGLIAYKHYHGLYVGFFDEWPYLYLPASAPNAVYVAADTRALEPFTEIRLGQVENRGTASVSVRQGRVAISQLGAWT